MSSSTSTLAPSCFGCTPRSRAETASAHTHDFTNLNGFQPVAWGPATHFWQHSIASYWQCRAGPVERAAFEKFTECLLMLLFCRTCRESFVAYYRDDPFDATQSWTLYLYRVHEFVNRKLGKPPLPLELLDDLYPPEDATKLSVRFVHAFWTQAYLFALNFPPLVKPTSARHLEVQQALAQMLHEVIPNLLPPTSDFTHAYRTAYNELRTQHPSTQLHFVSRDEAFHFVYHLQQRLHPNLFASCEAAQQYFEQVYRGGTSTTVSH